MGGKDSIWDVIEEKRGVIAAFLLGALFLGGFVLINNRIARPKGSEIQYVSGEVEAAQSESRTEGTIIVDVSGAVNNPGVFEFPPDTRVGTAVDFAGGLSPDVNREWVSKNLNLAGKLLDGQKMYIPYEGEVDGGSISSASTSSRIVDINTASASELDSLPGIGKSRSQAIIGGRPYVSIDELVSKSIIPQNVFDDIKDQITTY